LVDAREATALDESAIRTFLETDYQRLVGGLTLMTGSQPVAEDAVQEALARAWERSDRGESIESLTGWVAVAATNLVRSGLRRLMVERRARGRMSEPLHVDSGEADGRLDIVRAVRALPTRQRDAVVLHYYLDLPVAQIARALRVSDGAVKNALFNARQSIRRSIGAGEREETNDAI
jgi:RNA polymerase sigma-70 factor (ECF subfamily)